MGSLARKFRYSKVFTTISFFVFGLFYEKKYLTGYWFDTKRIGWLWALRCLPGRLFGRNRTVPWPVHRYSRVSNAKNVIFHNDSINVFQSSGCYFQALDAKIYLGSNVRIGPNCGLITTNHDIYQVNEHSQGKDIKIGNGSWIGMNSVILPGVELGENTIVGAGAVVTKSFPEGYCVLGGVPAKKIRDLEREDQKVENL